MADGFTVDFSELNQLAADLGTAPTVAQPLLHSAIKRTAHRIKQEARSKVTGIWSGVGAAIEYESKADSNGVTAEIGYDKGKAGGAAGNLREFGAPNATAHVLAKTATGYTAVALPGPVRKPLAPHNDLKNALENNQDDFVKGIETAIDDSLRRNNL